MVRVQGSWFQIELGKVLVLRRWYLNRDLIDSWWEGVSYMNAREGGTRAMKSCKGSEAGRSLACLKNRRKVSSIGDSEALAIGKCFFCTQNITWSDTTWFSNLTSQHCSTQFSSFTGLLGEFGVHIPGCSHLPLLVHAVLPAWKCFSTLSSGKPYSSFKINLPSHRCGVTEKEWLTSWIIQASIDIKVFCHFF